MALHHFGDAYSGFQAGIINGRVDHPIYFSNTETPPNPSAFIPFRRDPDFVDQETILDQIHHKCGRPGSRTALVGLGGVGKSQLAIEYAYRTREQSPETWIFWVHASSAARFEQSYRDIADHVKIPGRRNPSTNIFQLVHAWLCDEWRGQWILILDSVDDTGFLFDASTTGQDEPTNHVGGRRARQLVSYIPQSRNGSVLITTRSRRAARHLVEESDIVTVEPMTMGESLALIGKKLGKQDNMDSVVHLAAALEFLPLAIVQAAAYISKRSSRYSVRQYVEDFLKSDRKKASLLDFKDGQLRRDSDKSNSIIITWQISFDYIRHSRQSAANLLSLMSFFDRQEIPEALLRRRNEQANAQRDDKMGNAGDHGDEADDDHSNGDGDSDGSEYGDDEFEEDILTLREYSFISVIADRPSFKMHGLVQLATRKWLEAYGQQEEWNQRFIMNLDAELPTGEYENWVKCQALFPHAKSAMWASILYKAAWYARGLGNWAEAEEMSVRAMNVRIKVLGQEHEDTLSSMSMEAEELFLHVLDSRKRVLGPEHPETLASMGNLASTYWNQGRWDAAEKLFIQNPDTLTSMANLASTYRDQGQWKKAEKLEIYVTETQGRILGADHPSTLKCKAELALTLWNQGRRSDAEKVLGQEHPDTLSCMANLGMARRHRGKLTEAEELETRVLEVQQRILGAEHPSTLTSMANLASTFWSKGRWKDAEELLDQATEISKRVLANLAILEVQAIETSKRVRGKEHPDTLTCMASLATTRRHQGRWHEAEGLEREHPSTLKCRKA
ncbi:TPR-like protein [Periconia macrospinosa]|uniref:TPR-like protein n=1 Tax=Periconia macrospinosa TaxID=97972 RepID=A0A2V1D326_9PLEO|nr:TPR-like protein [Periconia macrospinosa]